MDARRCCVRGSVQPRAPRRGKACVGCALKLKVRLQWTIDSGTGLRKALLELARSLPGPRATCLRVTYRQARQVSQLDAATLRRPLGSADSRRHLQGRASREDRRSRPGAGKTTRPRSPW